MENYMVGSSVSKGCPMEIDSTSPETTVTDSNILLNKELLPVVKSDEYSWRTASSRSPSLPTLTGGIFKWNQEKSVGGKDLQSYDHKISPSVALNRSISYEQCYSAGDCADLSDPYVKVCKVEQKLEYYSPKKWKRTLVVETLTYNQEPSRSASNNQYTKSLSNKEGEKNQEPGRSTSNNRCTKRLSSKEGEKKVSGLKLRNVVCPVKARPCSTNDNIINDTFFKRLFYLVIPVFLIFSSGLIFRISLGSRQCEGQLDLENIEITLSREIFGQNLALTSFLDALKEIFLLNDGDNNSTMSVIMFIGGTGVGKSYMASIVNELYPANWMQIYLNAQVDLILKDSKAKALKEIVNKLSDCGTNLIIIDDAADFIRSHSMENRENFMEQLYFTAHDTKKKILLMLMLNDKRGENFWNNKIQLSQHVGETVNLLKGLGDIQTYTTQFTPLTQEHIVKCIRKSLEKEGIGVIDEEIAELLEKEPPASFLNGCKGIYKYVHELSIKNRSENVSGKF